MPQYMKCFLHKHEEMNSVPRTHVRRREPSSHSCLRPPRKCCACAHACMHACLHESIPPCMHARMHHFRPRLCRGKHVLIMGLGPWQEAQAESSSGDGRRQGMGGSVVEFSPAMREAQVQFQAHCRVQSLLGSGGTCF